MDYKVVVTAEAEEDLNQFIQYLLFAKKIDILCIPDLFMDTDFRTVGESGNICKPIRIIHLFTSPRTFCQSFCSRLPPPDAGRKSGLRRPYPPACVPPAEAYGKILR